MNEYKARRNGVVADGDVVVTSSRKGQQHQSITATQQQAPRPTERRVARLIQRGIFFAGADEFVGKHGARPIISTLKHSVLEWTGEIAWVHGVRLGWHPKPDVRNPAGLLRWELEKGGVHGMGH